VTSYIIETWDDKQYTVDDRNGLALMEAWTDSDKAFPVQLGNEAISSSAIKAITPQRLTMADMPQNRDYKPNALPSGKICRAQYSIQKEINNIAKDEGGPKGWAKLVTDKHWREETRQKLRQPGVMWCDYKAGECACD
jgi:hypothetical protein